MPDIDPTTRRVTLRELDALVAQHVFEWRVERETENGVSGFATYNPDGTRTWFTESSSGVRCESYPWKGGLPRYSTDWKHTGELWEHLMTEGRSAFLRSDRQREDNHWTAMVSGAHRLDAETGPVALCLAALRAYGVEVELEQSE